MAEREKTIRPLKSTDEDYSPEACVAFLDHLLKTPIPQCIDPKVGELLPQYRSGELADEELGDPKKLKAIKAHVQVCPGCIRISYLSALGLALLKRYYLAHPEEVEEIIREGELELGLPVGALNILRLGPTGSIH